MLLQDTQADGFGGVENSPTGYGALNRGGQGNNRGNISGPLPCHTPREQSLRRDYDRSGEFLSRLLLALFSYGLVQMTLDQEVRAVGVDPNAGKIWPVTNAP